MLRLSVFLLCITAVASADTAEDLLQRALKARGGTARLASIQSLRIAGTLDSAPIRVYAERPSRFRMELTNPDGLLTQLFDGSHGWQKGPGKSTAAPTALHGAELDRLRDQAANAIGGPLVDAAARGNKSSYAGRQLIDGTNCYELRIDLPTGTTIREFLDPKTYLTVHETIVNGGPAATPIEETIGSYKRFGGVLFACRFVSGPAGDARKYVLAIENIEVNHAPAPDLFQRSQLLIPE